MVAKIYSFPGSIFLLRISYLRDAGKVYLQLYFLTKENHLQKWRYEVVEMIMIEMEVKHIRKEIWYMYHNDKLMTFKAFSPDSWTFLWGLYVSIYRR